MVVFEKREGTYRRFENATAEELEFMIRFLGRPGNIKDRHNNAPSIEDCLKLGKTHGLPHY